MKILDWLVILFIVTGLLDLTTWQPLLWTIAAYVACILIVLLLD